jgi:hypothetical protein
MGSISTLLHNWHWLLVFWLIVLAAGVHLNWRREKRRDRPTDAEVRAMVGDGPRARGAVIRYGDAPARDRVARGPLDAYGNAANIGGVNSDGPGGGDGS